MIFENGTIIMGKWKSGVLEFGRCELLENKDGNSITLDKEDSSRNISPPLDVPFINTSHLLF